MSTAHRFKPHYTVADYYSWQGDWELWFGTAVAMSPSPFGPHERMVSEMAFRLQTAIKSKACDCCLYTGLDWIVQEDTVVRPDIMVVCGPQPEQHLERTPSLIVEVLSPATADKDRGPKRDLYQSEGVCHYLIADPDTGQLQWLKRINDQLKEQSPSQQMLISLHEHCELVVEW